MSRPSAAPGYYVDAQESSTGVRSEVNVSVVVQCVPFRACLGECSTEARERITMELDSGILPANLDYSGCVGGEGNSSCSPGYGSRRCSRCTPYMVDFCDENFEMARPHYRLDDLCVECPCSVFTFTIIMALLALLMVASLLLLDLFNKEFSSHTSTLAAPFLIMITFAQVSLRNAHTCSVS